MNGRSVLLKVSNPSGKRIKMAVVKVKGKVVLIIPYIKEVDNDKPQFASKGVIEITIAQKDYTRTKNMLTKYLEDLFLKELSNADTDTSHGSGSNRGRTKTKSTAGSNETASRKGSNSVCNSGGGNKPSEGSRIRAKVPKPIMAKSDSKDTVPSGKEGD